MEETYEEGWYWMVHPQEKHRFHPIWIEGGGLLLNGILYSFSKFSELNTEGITLHRAIMPEGV